MENQPNHPRTLRDYLRLFLTGFAMGSADIVPGVSGGTMAFILGVYQDLLDAIKSFNVEIVKLALRLRIREALDRVPWQFLLVLGLGVIAAVFTLARGLSWLLEHQPVYLFAFFFGLVLASIVAIGTRVRWAIVPGITLLSGAVAAFWIVGLVPIQASHDPLTLFLSGMVAIMAMILPGISGSFILLILGQYAYVLNAVKDLNVVAILSVAGGCVVGILGFSRILSWLLRRYQQATVAALVGFMIGSLRKIWPWKEMEAVNAEIVIEHNVLPDAASPEFLAALVLSVVGFIIISILDHLQSKSNPLVLVLGRATALVTRPSQA
jgi:putative membrane protein